MYTKALLSMLLLMGSSVAIDDAIFEKTAAALEAFHQNYPQEKFYVFNDKPYYVLGEDLWFSVYGCHAIDHSPLTPSGLVYAELISPKGEILANRNIQIAKGIGRGDFKLDPNWKEEGDYALRVYSQYQRNFESTFIFQKRIAIYDSYKEVVADQKSGSPMTGSNVKVEFFPEGGDLVQGLSSVVAVKSMGDDLKGTAIKGKVWDQHNNLITLFVTNERGFGSFSITPAIDTRYRVEILEAAGQPPIILPEALPMGHVLKIVNTKPDTIIIRAKSNLPMGLEDAFVIGHLRGKIVVANKFAAHQDQVLILPKSDLPSGILHFTLFNREGLPVAERLTFVKNLSEQIAVELEMSQASFSQGEEVKSTVIITDQQGKNVAGTVSATVFDQIVATRPPFESDIRSYFWLQSDVRGHIEDPAYYFVENDRKSNRNLELLLMTQGWRRFAWDKILNEPLEIKYLPENGFTIKGRTTRFLKENKGTASDIFLSGVTQTIEMLHTSADEEGNFIFSDLQIRDTTAFVLQANRDKEGGKKKKKDLAPSDKNPVNLFLETRSSPSYVPNQAQRPIRPSKTTLQKFLNESRYSQVVDDAYANLWTIDLEEIVVREEKVVDDIAIHEPAMLYREPDDRIILDSLPNAAGRSNIFDVINGRFSGVEIIGSYPNKTARIRGINSINLNSTAMILLDGTPVSEVTANTIPVDRVAFVDVIKSLNKTAVYGRNNGVIAIYTKVAQDRNKKESKTGVLNMEHPGYYRARQFYQPPATSNSAKPDHRSTLYWQPSLELDGKKATLSFTTADRSSIYELRVEGMSSEGIPIVGSTTFNVQ